MSEKNILVIRAKKKTSEQKLKEFQTFWNNQTNEGIVVIPGDFEFFPLDPETLKPCEIGFEQIKKDSLWRKLLRRIWKKDENTKRNS